MELAVLLLFNFHFGHRTWSHTQAMRDRRRHIQHTAGLHWTPIRYRRFRCLAVALVRDLDYRAKGKRLMRNCHPAWFIDFSARRFVSIQPMAVYSRKTGLRFRYMRYCAKSQEKEHVYR